MRRVQDAQRFPAFGTSHAEIHGIVGTRRQVNGGSVPQVNVESTTGRAVAADHRCGCVRLVFQGHFAESKLARCQQQLTRERAGPFGELRK